MPLAWPRTVKESVRGDSARKYYQRHTRGNQFSRQGCAEKIWMDVYGVTRRGNTCSLSLFRWRCAGRTASSSSGPAAPTVPPRRRGHPPDFLIALLSSAVGAICGIGGGVVIKPVMDMFRIDSVAAIQIVQHDQIDRPAADPQETGADPQSQPDGAAGSRRGEAAGMDARFA